MSKSLVTEYEHQYSALTEKALRQYLELLDAENERCQSLLVGSAEYREAIAAKREAVGRLLGVSRIND